MLPPRARSRNGIALGGEDVAYAEDVGAAEEHDAVAVGVGGGLVEDHYGFAVEEEVFGGGVVFVVGQAGLRRWGLAAGHRGGHAVQNIVVRDDGGSAAHYLRGSGGAHFLEGLVAADVVAVHVGVDDVADGLVAELLDFGGDALGQGGEHGVD